MFKYIVVIIIAFEIMQGYAEECIITEDTEPIQKEKQLREDLLCNYNKHFVPLINRSEVMDISMSMQIYEYSINEYGPITLHLESEIEVKWFDEFLNWNPGSYDSISELVMTTDEIWSPEIMPQDMQYFIRSSSLLSDTKCKVTSKGNVTCTVSSSHSGSCSSDVSRWPYDEHFCDVQYLALSYGSERLNIAHPANDTLTVKVPNTSEWRMLETHSGYYYARTQMSLTIHEMSFEFMLVRNVGYEMQYNYIAVFALVSMSLLCFWTNFETHERIILCLINIIGHTWEIDNIQWKMPTMGHTVPYVICFYRDSIILAFFILVETVIFKKILTSDKPAPSWLDGLGRIFGRVTIRKILFVQGISELEFKNGEQSSYEDDLKFIKQINQIAKKQNIQILDRIVFICYLITYCIMGTVIFTYLI